MGLSRVKRKKVMKQDTATIDRLVEPIAQSLKSNEGLLSPAEQDEYETRIRFGNFIAIIQAKARSILKGRIIHDSAKCASARAKPG